MALPSGIKANTLQTEFHTELGLLAKGSLHSAAEDYPFRVDIVYDGTKPTTGSAQSWESLWKIQIYTNIWKLGGTSPAITYQSGKQGGFTYDHQIIVGLLVKFLTPESSR